jgi:hypothetical protein
MSEDINESVTKKTDKELLEYLRNTDRYSPESLVLVINELKVRGRKFSDEELKTINNQTGEEEEIIEKEYAFRPFFTLKKNVVSDSNAPLLYSQLAIMAFSTFFSVIFGSILFSLNVDGAIKKTIVIVYGVLFTSFALYVGNLAPYSSIYIFFINAVGGCLLTHEIWKRFIGGKTKYRTKPVLMPLIISVMITALLLLLMI